MTINMNGISPWSVCGSGQTGQVSVPKVEKLPGAVMPDQPVNAPEKLQLTPESLQLRQMEATLGNESVFNQKRVEALRKAIASGEYRVDSTKIAGKLLELEKQLFK
jgi:negative regulator of flagellin synthesis FlgM